METIEITLPVTAAAAWRLREPNERARLGVVRHRTSATPAAGTIESFGQKLHEPSKRHEI